MRLVSPIRSRHTWPGIGWVARHLHLPIVHRKCITITNSLYKAEAFVPSSILHAGGISVRTTGAFGQTLSNHFVLFDGRKHKAHPICRLICAKSVGRHSHCLHLSEFLHFEVVVTVLGRTFPLLGGGEKRSPKLFRARVAEVDADTAASSTGLLSGILNSG